jgi:hypothetical protein
MTKISIVRDLVLPRKESYVLTQMPYDFGLKREMMDDFEDTLASDFKRRLKIKT